MAKAGWYPDPGGQPNTYRYWDGRAWSAVTSPNPAAPPPSTALGSSPGVSQSAGSTGQGQFGQGQFGQQGQFGRQDQFGQQGAQYGNQQYGQGQPGQGSAYAGYQQAAKKRGPAGWWIGIGALVLVIVLVAVFAVRTITSGGGDGTTNGTGTQDACPTVSESVTPGVPSNDGRVHGGPVSYPELGAPWSAPSSDNRVPFGSDVLTQTVSVEPSYQPLRSWVASILVGKLLAGDGFFTPEDGSKIVVKCIIGAFYDNSPVQRDDKVNKAMTVDGHDAWIVESHLSFDIKGLRTKGELLIVVIVNAGETSGLYYASIPDTTPELVQPARDALKNLTVD